MSREQLLELEDVKRSLLVQAYRMKQEHPHMSPVGIEMEMYSALMAGSKRDHNENPDERRGIGDNQ